MPSSKKAKKKRPNTTNGHSSGQNNISNHHDEVHCLAKDNNKLHSAAAVCPDSIKGTDDTGVFYNSHDELTAKQLECREEFYAANDAWWIDGGYGGKTDDELMVGDEGSEEDGAEGLAFLDRLLERIRKEEKKNPKQRLAIDLGAGVGRVSKQILLKRYDTVHLVEANEAFSKRSRGYLGRKRAARCFFTVCHLQDITPEQVLEWGPVDLMWLQWTLQYLTDSDAVDCLRILANGCKETGATLVLKENRPFGNAREDRFQMDVPAGGSSRYDITRPDSHHRLLFQRAGLRVDFAERGVETNTYALTPMN